MWKHLSISLNKPKYFIFIFFCHPTLLKGNQRKKLLNVIIILISFSMPFIFHFNFQSSFHFELSIWCFITNFIMLYFIYIFYSFFLLLLPCLVEENKRKYDNNKKSIHNSFRFFILASFLRYHVEVEIITKLIFIPLYLPAIC